MNWFGKPTPQNRFLGQVDQDDPTNLPMGLAAVCRNNDFTRDSGGPTCAVTRAGINLSMQCVDPNAPVTGLIGFVYEPELASQAFYQMPLAFQPTVGTQREFPVGTGRMIKVAGGSFSEPLNVGAHKLSASAGNKVWSAYSDLNKPLSGLSCFDPNTTQTNPFGMKPFGFNWTPGTTVLAGEVCTPSSPSTGNGHTYRALNSGITAANAAAQPIWPLATGGIVYDNPGPNQIEWVEQTMIITNRLPAPPAPALALAVGTIATGQDVYILITFTNTYGETLPSVAAVITTIAADSGVAVTIPTLASLAAWIQGLGSAFVPTAANIYVAVQPHGNAAPPASQCFLSSTGHALGSSVTVTAPATGGGSGPGPITGYVITSPGANYPSATISFSGSGGATATVICEHGWVVGIEPGAGGSYTVAPLCIISGSGEGAAVQAFITPSGGTGTGTPPPTACTARVTAGQLPTPTALPNIDRDPGGGTFPAGRDVYVGQTYTNAVGETMLGPANVILNTNADDAVQVTVAVPEDVNNNALYSIVSVGIYEADVATGTPAPSPSSYNLVGYYKPGSEPLIATTAQSSPPPLTNTTGTAGQIAADTATGGLNGTQGQRYAALLWMNANETVSGFTLASVVSTIVDEDGWQLGAFNIPIGPAYVVGRIVAFTIADGTPAGPFGWIGLVDLIVPSQNVVYPNFIVDAGVEQIATVILDNVTQAATFNFTDTYLDSANNVDDRLDVITPPQACRVDYLKTVDRLALTGVSGLASGAYISLGEDYESFYGDNSPVPITSNGEKCFGLTDAYKSIIFALCEESGYTISANSGNPNSWDVKQRWGGDKPGEGVGPCGFRAWAACGKFIMFAHRTGLYRYDESDPDMMSKEVPKAWGKINWAAASCIEVTIDEDTHTVRVQAPTGLSTVPNQEFCLSYIEGWQSPIHFSTFAAKEISMDACRRWSFNDVAAFVCVRLKRTLLPGTSATLSDDGPGWETLPDSSFGQTQLLFGSSGPDGGIQARTPGIFADNGAGIDDQYETMSASMMLATCKAEGINLNATGNGTMFPSFLAARDMVIDENGGRGKELKMRPVALSPNQPSGITRKVPPKINEYWRVRFTNGKTAGSWKSLKSMTVYLIPWSVGRDSGDK